MTNIDNKVVSFDLKGDKFREGARNVLETLEKLRQGLKFEGAGKGLENIAAKTKGIDMNSLASAIETVKNRFSTMGVAAMAAIANITNKLVNLGLQAAKSMSLKPLMDGFSEYELNINSVQTILANTARHGSTLADVNKSLDELNNYADKTIYNFAEMTRNIGTFTVAGIKLEDATAAVKGFSNMAALSGANSTAAAGAMYQLSQAMSSGVVKLQDWMSIEKQGIAGVEFRDALMMTAKVHGKNVDAMIKKHGSFRNTLSEGWLTAEIMTKTLSVMTGDLNVEQIKSLGYTAEQAKAMYDMAQRALDAATVVKTLTGMLDTLKEVSGSGWAKTWQLLLGDFEQAKVLFTNMSNTLTGFVERSAEARNNLLEGWSKLEGRTVLIEGLTNAWKAMVSVVKPIQQAFRDIFPPTTAQQLFDLTVKFRNFTAGLGLSEKRMDLLRRTMRGVFAVFNIAGKIIGFVVKAITGLFGAVTTSGGGILELTARLGDMLSWVDRTIFSTKLFDGLLKGLTTTVKIIAIPFVLLSRAVKELYSRIVEAMPRIKEFATSLDFMRHVDTVKRWGKAFADSLGGMGRALMSINMKSVFDFIIGAFKDLSQIKLLGIDVVIKKITDRFKSLSWVGSAFVEYFKPVIFAIKTVIGWLGKLGSWVLSQLEKIGAAVRDWWGKSEWNQKMDVANIGLGAGLITLLAMLWKAVNGIKLVNIDFKNITSPIEALKGTLEGLTGTLKADMLMTIALAIGVLTLSLVALSLIDSKKLGLAVTAMGAMFSMLIASIKGMENLFALQLPKLGSIALLILGLSASLILLAIAMKIFGSMDVGTLIKSGVAAIALIITLAQAVRMMAVGGGVELKGMAFLIGLGLGLIMIAGAVKMLASIEPDRIKQGVGAVTALIAILGIFMRGMNVGPGALGSAVMLVTLAHTLNRLAKVVDKFSKYNPMELVKGVGTLILLLTFMALFAKSSEKSGKDSAVTVAAIAGSLFLIALALERIALLDIASIIKGLITLGAALGIIMVAMKYMPKDTMYKDAISLALLSASLLLLAFALERFGNFSPEQMVRSLTMLSVSLVTLMVALAFIDGTEAIKAAGAITIIAVAFMLLLPVLLAFGAMSMSAIGKSLLMFSGVLLVFIAVGALAIFIWKPLLLLAAAILAIGVAVALTGVGMVMFASGLGTLAALGPKAVTALNATFKEFLKTLPEMAKAFVKSLTVTANAISGEIPAFAKAASKVVMGFLNEFGKMIPQVMDFVGRLIISMLGVIDRHMPEIQARGYAILIKLLQGIRDNIEEITTLVAEIITKFLNALAAKIPDLVQAGANLLIAYIQGYETQVPRIAEAGMNLVVTFLREISSRSNIIMQEGVKMILEILKGVTGNTSKVVAEGGKMVLNFLNDMGRMAVQMVAAGANVIIKVLEGVTKNLFKVVDKGIDVVLKFIEGLGKKSVETARAAADILIDFLNGMASAIREKSGELRSAGGNIASAIVEGLIGGLSAQNVINRVVNSAINLGKKAIGGLHTGTESESPSKAARRIGEFVGAGLVLGIQALEKQVTNAGAEMGVKVLKSIGKSVEGVDNLVNQDLEFSPTIRPVIDLTDFKKGASLMDGMLPAAVMDVSTQVPNLIEVGEQVNVVVEAKRTALTTPVLEKAAPAPSEPTEINFHQYNTSPKALPRSEIYRQTRNQLWGAKTYLHGGTK